MFDEVNETLINDTMSTPVGVDYGDMVPVLIQCFTIILMGYISGRCGIVTDSGAAAINVFVTNFSLPAVIFTSLVVMDFSGVHWNFLIGVFVAKILVFVAVAIVTMILVGPDWGKAGLYAIFSTQSNDYALGYPLISSLYGNKRPEFGHYIYLLAPLQLLILTPIGFCMMEYHRQRGKHSGRSVIVVEALKSILKNPIILLTVLGVMGNFCFDHKPPLILTKILDVLADAFPSLALFLLGQNMVGKVKLLAGYAFVEPVLLILMKILVLPLLIHEIVNQLMSGSGAEEVRDFSSFGFLYGTFPTAPTVFIFATAFDLETVVVSSGMVACTIFSAPLMFISASLTTMSLPDMSKFRKDFTNTAFISSIIGLTGCLWFFIIFAIGRKWRSVTHSITIHLAIAQTIAATGGILFKFMDMDSPAVFYLQTVFTIVGVFAARVWTAVLAFVIAMIQWRSLCVALSYGRTFVVFGYGITFVIAMVLTIRMFFHPMPHQVPDINFQFGRMEAYIAFTVLSACLTVTVVCLIVQQRFREKRSGYCSFNLPVNWDEADIEPNLDANRSLLDVEDLGNIAGPSRVCPDHYDCSDKQRKKCNHLVQEYFERGRQEAEMECQQEMLHHVVLLIFLCISMVVGLALCLWKIIADDMTGIYIELQFLDIVFNFGQGIFTFVVFALNYQLIARPLIRCYRRLRYGNETLALPPLGKLLSDTLHVCEQFLNYHYEACVEELATHKTVGGRQLHSVFRGKELVTWLVAVGLARDRVEGVKYGKSLLLGRIIRHVDSMEHFHDNNFVYLFLPNPILRRRPSLERENDEDDSAHSEEKSHLLSCQND